MEAAIVLAEELNYSRASQRLRLTQPALTKRIVDLESRFHISLFDRDTQAVALTDAGRAFVEEARLALLHSERAVQAARSVLANAETILRVGKSPYGNPFLVSTLLSIRLPLYPRLKVVVSSGYPADLVHDLLSGRADLAFLTEPPESPMLSMMKVAEEPLFVAFFQENALSERHELKLSDLNHCTWVLLSRKTHPLLFDSVMRAGSDRGVHPSNVYQVLAPEEGYPYLSEQGGFALLPRTAALGIARDGITIRPLAEQRISQKTFLASRVDNDSKMTSEMVRAFGRKLRTLEGRAA